MAAMMGRASGDLRDRERDRDLRDRDREREREREPRGGRGGPPFHASGGGPPPGPMGYGRSGSGGLRDDGYGGPPPYRGGGMGGPSFRGGPGGPDPFLGRNAGGFRGADGPYGGPPQGQGGPGAHLPPVGEVFAVDREKICPLLIRVFIKPGSHHRLEDFAVRGKEPGGDAEIQIYTWMDATLRELSDLIKEVKPAARGRATRLSFAFVYPDKRGRNVMRQVGLVHSTRPTDDDAKTLKALSFQTGDFLDVAIL